MYQTIYPNYTKSYTINSNTILKSILDRPIFPVYRNLSCACPGRPSRSGRTGGRPEQAIDIIGYRTLAVSIKSSSTVPNPTILDLPYLHRTLQLSIYHIPTVPPRIASCHSRSTDPARASCLRLHHQ